MSTLTDSVPDTTEVQYYYETPLLHTAFSLMRQQSKLCLVANTARMAKARTAVAGVLDQLECLFNKRHDKQCKYSTEMVTLVSVLREI